VPRVLVNRNLKWNDRSYPPGVAVDMPEDIIASLPEGTVRAMPRPENYPVHEPPSPPPAVKAEAGKAPAEPAKK
jgi:hypothetical protein